MTLYQHKLIGLHSLFKEMTFSRRYLHTNLCFMSSWTAALVWQHSRIICLCFAHFPFRPGIHYLKPHLTQSSIDQKSWWAKLKLSKRCCFQEWLLWVISMMDPWALWHSPVICVVGIHTVNTLCRGSAIHGLFPTLLLTLIWCIVWQARVLDDASIALQVLDLAVGLIILSSPASLNYFVGLHSSESWCFSFCCEPSFLPTLGYMLTTAPAASIEILKHPTVNVHNSGLSLTSVKE